MRSLWLVVFLTSVARAQAPPPSPPTLALRSTTHYHLLTDLSDEAQLKTLESFLEGCHATFADLIGEKKPVRKLPRPVVRIFRRKSDYAQYGKEDKALRFNPNWRGYYARPRNELVSYLGQRPMSDLCSILSHEGLHQFAWEYVVRPGSDRLPDWFEEGLADYLRSPRLGPDGKLTRVPKAHHVGVVKSEIKHLSFPSWRKLWSTDPAALVHPEQFASFYAHSYGMVRFLMEKGGKGRVRRIFRLKREGVFNEDLLLRVFPPEQRDGLHRAFLGFFYRLKDETSESKPKPKPPKPKPTTTRKQ